MAAPVRPTDGNPTLLLVHAAGLGRGSWDRVVARIPGFARTVAIDLPGHGDTPGLAYDTQVVPRLAEHVAGQIAALGLHRPHVVGHSLGGAVALELAHRVPLAAVTAFCTIGFCSARHATVRAAKVRALVRLVRRFGPVLRRRLLCHAAVRWLVMSGLSAKPTALGADVTAADVTSMIDSDLVEMIRFAGRYAFGAPGRLAHTPVNLVWADQDRIVPASAADRARRAFPHARQMVIAGCGHLVMRDDPDGMAAVIHACHTRLMIEHQRRGVG
ncbi:MAG TPA: alpha/beta hydrolase [Actinophytocola sp.]|jgi:pimeloyl-ACP methyl ester carboxylesterase|nr:alpha/beta hydrolase [Actinophytocola sp.]